MMCSLVEIISNLTITDLNCFLQAMLTPLRIAIIAAGALLIGVVVRYDLRDDSRASGGAVIGVAIVWMALAAYVLMFDDLEIRPFVYLAQLLLFWIVGKMVRREEEMQREIHDLCAYRDGIVKMIERGELTVQSEAARQLLKVLDEQAEGRECQ